MLVIGTQQNKSSIATINMHFEPFKENQKNMNKLWIALEIVSIKSSNLKNITLIESDIFLT